MSREFPDWVDPWKAADGRRTFAGTMPLKRFERLAPLLAREGSGDIRVEWPDARFSATFGHDSQGLVVIDLQVAAELPLICQRSLEPYLEAVERHSELAVIADPADQDRVSEYYDLVQADQGRLALQILVEDELLLALPEVPRNPAIAEVHRSTDAGANGVTEIAGDGRGSDEVAEPTHRPFEGLADLMKSRKS